MNKEAFKTGILPGLVATICCLAPLILIMMGLISASTALSIVGYGKWFLGLSLVLLIGTLWFSIKKRRQIICSGCENKNQERRRIIALVIFSTTVTLLTYAFVLYVLIPWLGPIVFKNFYTVKKP